MMDRKTLLVPWARPLILTAKSCDVIVFCLSRTGLWKKGSTALGEINKNANIDPWDGLSCLIQWKFRQWFKGKILWVWNKELVFAPLTGCNTCFWDENFIRVVNGVKVAPASNHFYPESTYVCLQTAVEFLEIISTSCVYVVCGEGVRAALLHSPIC